MRVDLPDDMPAISMNDRTHWSQSAGVVSYWRMVTKAAVKRAQVPALPRARVTLHCIPPDDRRRDRTNLVATYKAVCDGFVDAGRIKDDSPEFLDDQMPVIHPSDGVRKWRWWLEIEPVTDVETVATCCGCSCGNCSHQGGDDRHTRPCRQRFDASLDGAA